MGTFLRNPQNGRGTLISKGQEEVLVSARSQLMLELRDDAQRRRDAVVVLDELVQELSQEGCVRQRHVGLVHAAQRVVDAAVALDEVWMPSGVRQAMRAQVKTPVEPVSTGRLSRKQRCAAERKQRSGKGKQYWV